MEENNISNTATEDTVSAAKIEKPKKNIRGNKKVRLGVIIFLLAVVAVLFIVRLQEMNQETFYSMFSVTQQPTLQKVKLRTTTTATILLLNLRRKTFI
ncbi:MAG: hypothetical protein UU86_C0046G0013 [candidate division WWE3 bacterium GW2011_GWC1_42_102]|nr:MAG: hypothetical protein UU86_C0046G0013 [candidate division WWE3 bacterium GW2011_GWC1_42_102]